MPSSNPAFNRGFANAGNGSQYPGWGAQPQQYGAPTQYGAPAQHDPYAAPSPYAPPTTRYMTMDDVVTKTGISFLVTVLTAAAVWAMPGQAAWGLAIPAVLVAFVLGLVISFKQIANPVATLAYGAVLHGFCCQHCLDQFHRKRSGRGPEDSGRDYGYERRYSWANHLRSR